MDGWCAGCAPSFVRLWFGGACLADVGVDGGLLDQRIKLIFPPAAGVLPTLGSGDDWYTDWLALPQERRGWMRTYTPRDLVGTGERTELVVDVVVHEHGPSGPGNDFALRAVPGGRGGSAAGVAWGGIEFRPGDADRLLVVADETAAPAAYGILRDLPGDARGCVLVEVPTPGRTLLARWVVRT